MGDWPLEVWADLLEERGVEMETDFATEAEKIGLMVHIGRCYRKMGKHADAAVLYHWAHRHATKHFGQGSPLVRKLHTLVSTLEPNRPNTL